MNGIPHLDDSRVSSFSPTSATSDFPRTPFSETPPGLLHTHPSITLSDTVSPFSWSNDQLDTQTCITADWLFANEKLAPHPIPSATISPVSSTSDQRSPHYPVQGASNTITESQASRSFPVGAPSDSSNSTSSRGRGWRRGFRRGRGQHMHTNDRRSHGLGLHTGEDRPQRPTVSQLEAEIAQKDVGMCLSACIFFCCERADVLPQS